MLEFSVENLQKIKTAIHIAQAVFIFPAWCLVIAVYRSDAVSRGPLHWYFAVCFLSIPAIIYLSMTLAFPRSRKWANAYAFVTIDLVFTVIWLSAFAAVAAWNSSDSCLTGCNLSKALVGLGFFIFLFFGLTSAISVYGAAYYRRNGALPGASRVPHNAAMIDPDVEAFSTAPHDEYAPVLMNDKDDTHEMHGGEGSQRYDTSSYGGADSYQPSYVSEVGSQSGGFQEPAPNRVQFPAGNYH